MTSKGVVGKMTSKEALTHLCIIATTPEFARSIDYCYDIVLKDLEVLQVLKDKLPRITTLRVMEYEGTYDLYNSINSTSITKEEYELLKEWLK